MKKWLQLLLPVHVCRYMDKQEDLVYRSEQRTIIRQFYPYQNNPGGIPTTTAVEAVRLALNDALGLPELQCRKGVVEDLVDKPNTSGLEASNWRPDTFFVLECLSRHGKNMDLHAAMTELRRKKTGAMLSTGTTTEPVAAWPFAKKKVDKPTPELADLKKKVDKLTLELADLTEKMQTQGCYPEFAKAKCLSGLSSENILSAWEGIFKSRGSGAWDSIRLGKEGFIKENLGLGYEAPSEWGNHKRLTREDLKRATYAALYTPRGDLLPYQKDLLDQICVHYPAVLHDSVLTTSPNQQSSSKEKTMGITTPLDLSTVLTTFPNQQPPSKEKTMAITAPLVLSTKTYVNVLGTPLEGMHKDEIYSLIKQQEDKIEELNKIKTQPAALQAEIKAYQDGINNLVKWLDDNKKP